MYKIYYKDGKSLEGGRNLYELGWKELSENPIAKVEFTLAGKTVILEGFEEYSIQVEHAVLPFSKMKGLHHILVIGRTGKLVKEGIFDLLKGRLYTLTTEKGKEYGGKLKIIGKDVIGWTAPRPITGWKLGYSGGQGTLNIV